MKVIDCLPKKKEEQFSLFDVNRKKFIITFGLLFGFELQESSASKLQSKESS